jgi:NAD(P)-dependent dehydrogenase (short-subunit alcohol dehydrogenase family)
MRGPEAHALPPEELHGQVAVITGAGEGIGRSCALALAAAGADVVLAARRAAWLETLAAEVSSTTGRRALAVPTDIAEPAQCQRLIDTAVAELGRVDIVVNVATLSGQHAPVLEADWDRWRAAFEVNVVGTLEVSRAAARHMVTQGGGSIVQISTLGVQTMQSGQGSYTATKSAMMVASYTMARELGPQNVRVNVVTPGYTTGDDLDRLFATIAERTGRDPVEVSRRAASTAALRRHVDPEDLAQAVLFLASPRARNITGVELHVNAGQSIG